MFKKIITMTLTIYPADTASTVTMCVCFICTCGQTSDRFSYYNYYLDNCDILGYLQLLFDILTTRYCYLLFFILSFV